jgi:hypothetical protein
MEYIDDLSYSNLVNLIQGEDTKGADILNIIAHEMKETDEKIKKLEKELQMAKCRKENLVLGSHKIVQHLKKDYPLNVQRNGYVIIITRDNITINNNVI